MRSELPGPEELPTPGRSRPPSAAASRSSARRSRP